jgi:hypothetical protein
MAVLVQVVLFLQSLLIVLNMVVAVEVVVLLLLLLVWEAVLSLEVLAAGAVDNTVLPILL